MVQITSCLELAKLQVALRALRYGHFPADIFDEYAWDMLLHMYIARLRAQPIYFDNVVNLTSKNTSVGSRWMKHLLSDRLAVADGERVDLTDDAFARMDEYHREALGALV